MEDGVKAWIGIDPGITGAIAVIPVALPRGLGAIPRLWDTPTIQLKVGKSLKSQMDASACYWRLRELKELYGPIHVVMEKVAPMPSTHSDFGAKMGAASAFGYGKGIGIWIGIMTALEIPYEEVMPVVWKRAMLPGMGKEKGASVLKATQLFPQVGRELTRVKDHGRAEALLIAEWGRRAYDGRIRPSRPRPLEELGASLF